MALVDRKFVSKFNSSPAAYLPPQRVKVLHILLEAEEKFDLKSLVNLTLLSDQMIQIEAINKLNHLLRTIPIDERDANEIVSREKHLRDILQNHVLDATPYVREKALMAYCTLGECLCQHARLGHKLVDSDLIGLVVKFLKDSLNLFPVGDENDELSTPYDAVDLLYEQKYVLSALEYDSGTWTNLITSCLEVMKAAFNFDGKRDVSGVLDSVKDMLKKIKKQDLSKEWVEATYVVRKLKLLLNVPTAFKDVSEIVFDLLNVFMTKKSKSWLLGYALADVLHSMSAAVELNDSQRQSVVTKLEKLTDPSLDWRVRARAYKGLDFFNGDETPASRTVDSSDVSSYCERALKQCQLEKHLHMRFEELAAVEWEKFGVPFDREVCFVGRAHEIQVLEEALKDPDNVDERKWLLSGTPGVGKTTIATETCFRVKETDNFLVWWIRCAHETVAMQDFGALAQALNIKEGRKDSVTLDHVKQSLSERKNWILVLDSVRTEEDIRRYCPNTENGGFVLATSSSTVNCDGFVSLSVDVFSLEEAKEYVRKRCGDWVTEEQENTEELVEELGRLPLSLMLASTYIIRTNSELGDLLQAIEDEKASMLKENEVDPANIANVTIMTSIIMEEAQNRSRDTAELLSYLNPEGVTRNHLLSYLNQLFVREDEKENSAEIADKVDEVIQDEAVEDLMEFGFIADNPVTDELYVHQEVQASIRGDIETERRRTLQESITAVLYEEVRRVKKGEERSYTSVKKVLQHCEAISSWSIPSPLFYDLLEKVGEYYLHLPMAERSLELFNRVLEFRRDRYGDESVEAGRALAQVGEALILLWRYEEAKTNIENSLAIRKAAFGEHHTETADSYELLGRVHRHQDNMKKAMECHEKALEIRIRLFGEQNEEVAKIHNQLGLTYSMLLDFDNAMTQFTKAKEIFVNALGERHPEVAYCYINIGDVHMHREQNEHAIEAIQKAADILVDFYGEVHPAVATAYTSIATANIVLGSFRQPLNYLEKALDINLICFGEKSIEVSDTYHWIGVVCECLQEFDQALKYYKLSLDILVSLLDQDSIEVVSRKEEVAGSLHQIENFAESLHIYGEVLDTVKRVEGERCEHMAQLLKKIAEVHVSTKSYGEAEKMFRSALDIFVEVEGEKSNNAAAVVFRLAELMVMCEKIDSAFELFSKALEMYSSSKKHNREIGLCEFNIGKLYQSSAGKDNAAIMHFNNAIASFYKDSSKDTLEIADAYGALGQSLLIEARFSEALTAVENCLRIRKLEMGEDNTTVAATYESLGAVQIATGKFEEATDTFRRLRDLQYRLYGTDNEKMTSTYGSLGYIYHQLGDKEAATQCYEKMLKINQGDVACKYTNLSQQRPKTKKKQRKDVENVNGKKRGVDRK